LSARERKEARGCAASSLEGEKGDGGAGIDPRRGCCEAVEKCRGWGGAGSDAQRVKSSEAVLKSAASQERCVRRLVGKVGMRE